MRHLALFIIVLACVLPVEASTMSRETTTCPIDGEKIDYFVVNSGTQYDVRLDTRPVGPTISPGPLAVCPKDGFIAEWFDEAEAKKLREYVLSDEYKALKNSHRPWFLLGQLEEQLGRDSSDVGWSYVSAFWEAEDDQPDQMGEYASHVIRTLGNGLRETGQFSQEELTRAFVCLDIARRVGEFEQAQNFVSLIEEKKGEVEPLFEQLLVLQRQLVAAKDVDPHNMSELSQAGE